jgi:hypothetical protein
MSSDAMDYARLARIKGALKLESVGIRTGGVAIRPQLAEEFDLGPRAPYHRYIEVCEKRMKVLLENQ